MDRIAITGGVRLEGVIPISGAKNSAIKLMVASLLTDEPLRLTNMPRLADTRFLGKLLQRLGVEVEEVDGAAGPQTILTTPEILSAIAPYDLVRQMRASFNVLGPLVARTGQAKVSLPGGCAIGARPVDLHLMALEALGARIDLNEGYVYAQAPRGLKGAEIRFPAVSVGATEHAMLAAVLAQGETLIVNAAREPEIADLAACLVKMGANIEGAGTSLIRIVGVAKLGGATHEVAAPVEALLAKLEEAGVEVERRNDGVTVKRNGGRLCAVEIATDPYPGFPTDLQAQFMALMTLADGESVIRETIFENRFMHAPELARLGADITVSGGEACVRGVERLNGAPVMATDLRASVSLVIAALAAKGETMVNRVYHLDRGFEQLEQKLAACGAQVRRIRVDGEAEERE